MTKLYYTAPSDECFDDMKRAAERIWSGYDEPYRGEKMQRIAHVQNIGDNFMYLFAMFDIKNQWKCAQMLKSETKKAVRERMLDGGNPPFMIDQVLGVETEL